jgi:asparagine synthase (glutamine-hydrolysing)
MSGLCGWFSAGPAAMPLAEMAAPLGAAHPLRSAGHGLGAAALSASLEEASLYHRDGLLIVHWGERRDATAALARLWRTHGPQACAALSGHFAFALLDEGRAEALLAVDRSATRPLFYQMAGRSLLFASSREALARRPRARPAPRRCLSDAGCWATPACGPWPTTASRTWRGACPRIRPCMARPYGGC